MGYLHNAGEFVKCNSFLRIGAPLSTFDSYICNCYYKAYSKCNGRLLMFKYWRVNRVVRTKRHLSIVSEITKVIVLNEDNEVGAAIRFLRAKRSSAAQIRQLCLIYE